MKRTWWLGLLLGTAVTAPATVTSTVTFYRDVLPILQKHCQSCHRPRQVAPMPLLTYKETRPWAEAMKYVLLSKRMPPWFSEKEYAPPGGHNHVTLSEVDTIVRWVDQGAPPGDPKDAPPPAYVQARDQRYPERWKDAFR